MRRRIGIATASVLLVVGATALTGTGSAQELLPPEDTVPVEPTTTLAPPELGYPSISLVKTVSTAPDVCGTESEITVPEGTTVYYCYTVTRDAWRPTEGGGHTSIYLHSLFDDRLGVLLEDLPYVLQPGESINSVALGVQAAAVIETDTTNTATWSVTGDFSCCYPSAEDVRVPAVGHSPVHYHATASATVLVAAAAPQAIQSQPTFTG